MPAAESRDSSLEAGDAGGWWLRRWSSRRIVAGVADRSTAASLVLKTVRAPLTMIEAGQVHGSSVAIVGRMAPSATRIVQGADALLTDLPHVALLVRTADCLPIFLGDPSRHVVGIAHAGWRGLAAQLPLRMVAAATRWYHVRADELDVAIGPAIRSCCYEVGPEFSVRFERYVHEHEGRRVCDLVGVAIEQLRQGGVRADRIVDSGRCTACEPQHWFSVRREGEATGRLTSFILVRP